MPSKRYRKLTAKDLRKEYSEGIRDFPNVNLRGQNLKKADLQGVNFSGSQLQRANFSGANLQNCDFSDTRLHGANFSKAELKDAKFDNAMTGMSFWSSLISLIISFFVSSLGMLITVCIGILCVKPLSDQVANPEVNTQYMIVIAYIAIFIVSFLHFWVISLLKNMDEAVWGFLLTPITIFLVMLDQPLTSALSWCIILSGLIRVTKILFDRNYFLSLIPISIVIITVLTGLYNYEAIVQNSDNFFWILLIFGVLIINIVSSFSLAIIFVQISAITYQKNTIVLLILLYVILPILYVISPILLSVIFSSVTSIFPETITGIIVGTLVILGTLSVTLSVFGIPGIYIGWHALRGNPNYRLIRNCGTYLCRWFGTNFQEADLTNGYFSYATLHNANFTKANLKHTRWQGAKRMEYARFGNSYLRYSKIRKLMINSDLCLNLYSKER